MRKAFENRLLELHSTGMWNIYYVDRAIEIAKRYCCTGIIFHCNEFVDRVVFPSTFFSKEDIMEYNPVRNSITKNNQYYLKAVLERCAKNNLEFYVETKEFNFDDHLIYKYPEVIGTDGKICATHPFLFEYVEGKYREFLDMFPEVAGVIVSLGTKESKVTISANKCHCSRCQNTDIGEWYKKLITAMYKPISEKGKKFVVRDFAYDKTNQDSMLDAVESVSKDIIMAVKKAPHDYYPVSIDNPAIGKSDNQWVEFDTWGQFFALGAFPCSVVEDIHERLIRCYDKGVKGIMIRTDWENMTQASVFNSFNIVNAIGAAMISNNLDITDYEIYKAWGDCGLFSPLIADPYKQVDCRIKNKEDLDYFTHIVKEGFRIITKGMYGKKNLLALNSQIFDRIDHSWYIPMVQHNRDAWEPGCTDIFKPTEENIAFLKKEKEEALKMAQDLSDFIKSRKTDIAPSIQEYLDFLTEAFLAYIEGFALEIRTYMYVLMAENHKVGYLEKARESLLPYESLAERYKKLVREKCYGHQMLYMLDGDRLLAYKKSAEDRIAKIRD